MPRKYHYLKCETEYYQVVERGIKTFEVRRNNRNFQVFDMIVLQESVNGKKTERELPPKEIIYVLTGEEFGIQPGYCVMQVK